MLEWMGLNFYYYDGLQPKIRAGIINEHECSTRLVAQMKRRKCKSVRKIIKNGVVHRLRHQFFLTYEPFLPLDLLVMFKDLQGKD